MTTRVTTQVGVDLVDIERIRLALNRSGKGFLNRVYTAEERDYLALAEDPAPRAAGLWAAKEAAVKALGTGFRDGIQFQDITVRQGKNGQPKLHLSGRFSELASGLVSSSLSISHCTCHALATVVLEIETSADLSVTKEPTYNGE